MPDDWDVYGKIIASEYRKLVLQSLNERPRTPTQIAEKTGKHQSHISKTLSELSEMGLVEVQNPAANKGRLYTLTPYGEEIYREMSEEGILD